MIDTLAMAALFGLPVQRMIDSDRLEQGLWVRILDRANTMHAQMVKAQASHIGNAVARALGGR